MIVGIRVQLVVEEDGVTLLPRLVLERQCDKGPEPARHRVLARKEPVVGLHAELVKGRHRLGDHMAAHLARESCGDGFGEEEPHVGAIPGSRALDQRGQAEPPCGLRECTNVVLPRALVEIDGE